MARLDGLERAAESAAALGIVEFPYEELDLALAAVNRARALRGHAPLA